MTNSDNKYIIVGKIGSSFGVQGWVKIQFYSESPDTLINCKHWYIGNEADWKPIQIEGIRPHGKGSIVKLKNVATPEDARLLCNQFIAIPKSDLPPLKKNEFYWSDLIGLNVINKEGRFLGKVIYLLETGSNDVLVIKNEKEHAIPFLLGDVILNVDLEKGEIQADWELI